MLNKLLGSLLPHQIIQVPHTRKPMHNADIKFPKKVIGFLSQEGVEKKLEEYRDLKREVPIHKKRFLKEGKTIDNKTYVCLHGHCGDLVDGEVQGYELSIDEAYKQFF